MSAISNNTGAAWGSPPGGSAGAPGGLNPDGQNALQALLAFACIHEQAARRRQVLSSQTSVNQPQENPHGEEFALDEVLQLVAERAISITGADGVAIALAQEDAIICRAASGRIAPERGTRLDPNSGFSGQCLQRGQTIRCDDSEADARVNAQACRSLGTRSMVAVPLAAKQRVIGLIEAFSSETYGFNDADVRSLNLLGELILAAVRPAEEDRLAELARRILPAPSPDGPSAVDEAKTVKSPARVLVDEKFAPARIPPAVAPEPAAKQESPTKTEQVLSESPSAPVLEPQPAPVSTNAPSVRKKRSILGPALTAAAALIAAGLLWTLVWKVHRVEPSISANTQQLVVEVKSPDAQPQEVIAPEETVAKPGPTPEVTGIRHWSSADGSSVVVDLEDQVQYEAHTLDNPPRIYFDLHDTKLAPGLVNQSVEVNDVFLKRIRVAQPVEGVTRVVLETKREAEFSVSLDTNPYRLTIAVHKPEPVGVKVIPAPAVKPSPEIPAAAPKGTAANHPSSNSGLFLIVLDAGHGGWDLGTVGRKGLLEKDLVLDVVQRLGKLVEAKLGAEVIYTREDDSYLPLEKRAEIANLSKADLFLSVHANYSDLTTARGVETYYTNTYSSVKARTDDDDPALKQVNWTGVDIRAKVTDSHRLASDVQQALYGGLAARNPEVRNRGVKEAQYVVLTGTQMPAVLAEVSFVSSPADEDKLQNSEYRQQIAEALFRGIAKYHDEVRHTKLASAEKGMQ